MHDNNTTLLEELFQPVVEVTQLDDAQVAALSVVNGLLSTVGTIGNLMCCLVIMKNKALRRGTELFIVSLCVADGLVCLICQPMYVHALNTIHKHSHFFTLFRKTVTWISTLASVSNLFAVSIDRYMALSAPLKYKSRDVRIYIIFLILCIWIFSVSLGAAAAVSQFAMKVGHYFTLAVLLLILILYLRIFLIIRRETRNMAAHCRKSMIMGRKQSTASRISYCCVSREVTAARTIAILVGLFYLTWLPLSLVAFMSRYNLSSTAKLLFPYMNTLAFLNSTLNPYVYYMRGPKFRQGLRNLFKSVVSAT